MDRPPGAARSEDPTVGSPLPDPTRAHRRAVLCDPPPRFIQLRAMSSAGVFFARPLVGSRWTVRQGPLAQKTPTLLTPNATRARVADVPMRSAARRLSSFGW